MTAYTYRQQIAAPRETVFDVLADRLGYAEITPLRSVTLLRPGAHDAQGVGAVHRLAVLGKIGPQEEVTLIDRPSRFEYKIVAGAPVRQHTGVVTLAERADGGTDLEYTMDSTPLVPAPAFVMRPFLRLLIKSLATGIAAEATRQARSS